ncbi:Protein of unknown function DUF4917 [Nostoc flagelliforme CCNUN1]|uniref:DUF4917 family protein n=1 Tax=Nostoc flagelliforme CCNUN1 TaxID=2038116 RepID=A0A2K8SPS6_9NOSO|nr:DUF4917 family protein [Nostoc flagelliforme]AUB37459.1 Protein of unknown function DUF4917 [Nostoc flagelliforme CCNUN1]
MTLKSYEEIETNAKRKLLLGNGFSIGVSSKFSYSSLLQICLQENYLSDKDNRLFTGFDSKDFELILNRLSIAASANKILEIDFTTPWERYNTIRDALINAVKFVHPAFDAIDSQWIERVFSEFKQFETIFTTNYDLLIYWITGYFGFKGFTDYFWSDGLTFNQFDTEVRFNKIPVLYLHGALFIYKNIDRLKKIKANENRNLLDSIEEIWRQNYVPVFVSEGLPSAKMGAIYSDPYLTFAFSKFLEISGGITIFGHSLSVAADEHIVSAINKNKNLTNIAVSIYRGSKTNHEIQDEIDRIKSQLNLFTRNNGTLEFFDSATCPLSEWHQ